MYIQKSEKAISAIGSVAVKETSFTETLQRTIPKRMLPDLVPVSFAQQQMWFLSQISLDVPVYNETLTVYLPGPLDVVVLEQSLNEIIRRHEIWRTSFPLMDGQPVQVIHPTLTIKIPVIDLRPLSEAEREVEALRRVREEAVRPFDLAHGPLLRPILVRLSDEDHRLFLVLHHIIYDGTNAKLLLLELRALYEAFSNGRPSPLPPLPAQYADFAIWQREQLQRDVFEEQLAYWKQQLQDAPTSLELPTDRPRPPVQTYRGRQRRFTFSPSLVHSLKDLSRRERATFYVTLVASCFVLLHRYTEQDEILLGTPMTARRTTDMQELLGPFLNVQVLRAKLSANPPFKEFLKQVRNTVLEAHENRDLPFEYLVKELQPERNLAQNPLFQVMLVLESSLPELSCGWTITLADVDLQTCKFDLGIILDDRPEGLVGCFKYSSDLFDDTTIDRMVAHWQVLLESIVRDPSQHIEALPLLTEMEQEQFLSWNNTAKDYPQDQCLHQLLEAQVKLTPDAVAVIFEETQLTYGELNCKANQIAHVLQTMGVGPDTLVGIYMERSLEMVIALVAVLKAGGAYVPLEPSYPAERIAYMMQDAALSIVLTQQRLREQLPHHVESLLCLDQDEQLFAQQPTHDPTSAVQPDNLLYVIYTSGSTGRPKGVMNVHRALVNRLYWLQKEYQLTPADRVLQMALFGFDASVKELFVPLLGGATLVVARPLGRQDQAYLVSLIQKQQITVANFVPSQLHLFLSQSGVEHCTSLRYMTCGGEPLSTDLQNRFYAIFSRPDISLYNYYGPTETAIVVSRWICQRDSTETTLPIGYPLANAQLYILSRTLQRVPIGVVGELHIGGVCLARGYFNQPELNQEKFIPDPFSTSPGARLYKTGDLARYRSDGAIEFLGRIDHQIKLRGFRIELGEIETLLEQYPQVDQAVVALREDKHGDKCLVAYIVLQKNHTVTMSDLKHHVMKHVPDYMVPSAFVVLDSLPLTPNGKVNRLALPEPEPSRSFVGETYVAPTSLTHYQLVQIWEELLTVPPPISIRDNFFYLGGHSFLAARLINRMEEVFGKRLPMSTLFAGPTIEQLAKALQEQEAGGPWSPLRAIQPNGTKRPFFFLHGDYLGGAFYTFTLARVLGMDQPFYALEPFPFEHLPPSLALEDIAKAYIQTLQTIQPHGPYLLGGFCNGAVMAYEIARQIRAQGEQIDRLVLIQPATSWVLHIITGRAIDLACRFLRTSPEKRLEWFLRLRHIYKYIMHQREPEDIREIGVTDPSIHTLMPTGDALHQDYMGVITWLVSSYRYASYSGKITLLWPREEPFCGVWRRKVARGDNIDLDMTPGTHISCRTDYLLDLAEKLKTALAKGYTSEFACTLRRSRASHNHDRS